MPPKKFTVDLTDLVVNDRFQFKVQVGEGGSAVVWLADQLDPNRKRIRPVAIKVLFADSHDREALQSAGRAFDAEIRPLVDVFASTAIVQFITTDFVDLMVDNSGSAYTVYSANTAADSSRSPLTALSAFMIVTEYADGGCVGSKYREEMIAGASGDRYLDHLIDVCHALMQVHDRGVLHRDIKPDNLLWFRKQDRVKLTDFGIAQHLGDITGNSGFGTPAYASPQAFSTGGASVDSDDVYSLGCTLYELFTGKHAFQLARNQAIPLRLNRIG